jgi:hypothetical protein
VEHIVIKDQRGQSLTEFALLLPLLLLLICGIIDFGRIAFTYMHLNITAQEAVRLGGLGQGDLQITEFAKNYIVVGEPETLEVTIIPSEAERNPGEYVTVTLGLPFHSITPFISEILPESLKIITNSTIRVE